MANVDAQNVPDARPMVGGDGAHSYANNSAYQGGAVKAAKELIKEGIIDKLDSKIFGLNAVTNTFRIADFGCSTGTNTFIAVQNIIDSVELKFQHEYPSALEFQVFFNDHSDNDFNTLFKSLPQSRSYYAAGVPGSFYSSLFPKSSLHFVHSSYTLHWLSKVPRVDGVEGSIQTRRFVNEVMEAYAAQFNNDFQTFLNTRAQELVPGGLAALVVFAVPDGIPLVNNAAGLFYNTFGSCLVELAKMGVLSEEKVNSFDVPMHNPTPKELEGIIQRNGNFTIERMEKMTNPKQQVLCSASDLAVAMRAVYEGLVKVHFGDEFADKIFNHFATKAEENISIIGQRVRDSMMDLFILLKRI